MVIEYICSNLLPLIELVSRNPHTYKHRKKNIANQYLEKVQEIYQPSKLTSFLSPSFTFWQCSLKIIIYEKGINSAVEEMRGTKKILGSGSQILLLERFSWKL